MTRGFTGNALLKCSTGEKAADDDDNEEKIIIRVFGDYPSDRDSEVHIMKKLSDKGIIPPMHCG